LDANAAPARAALRAWCARRGTPIRALTFGVGAIVSLAGLLLGVVNASRGGVAPESALLAIGMLSFLIAVLVHAAQIQARIAQLRDDIREKDGYRHFVDHAAEGFFRTGPGGEILEINAAFAHIFGYETQHALRMALNESPQDFYLDMGRRGEFWGQLRVQGRVDEFISKVKRRDGTTIWVTENARSVHDEKGNFLYCEGTVQDITLQREALQATRRALQEAQESARAKAAFIAAMSHELKTPLNAVLGFSELMLQQLCGPIDERYRSYLADIHSNGRRLLDLVSDVIDFARIEGHALALTESTFRIDEAVHAARDAVLEHAKDPPEIDVRLPLQLLHMRGDRKRIVQVLSNVLSNAVKFTPASGSVSVKAYRGPDRGLLIEIADTGMGMSAQRIARALEPFRQGDETLARRYEGLGLGLPLAQALVRLHGGRLAITSAEGQGTTVNIALPAERVVPGESGPSLGASVAA
jgi:PAS domain S-box-containing protein